RWLGPRARGRVRASARIGALKLQARADGEQQARDREALAVEQLTVVAADVEARALERKHAVHAQLEGEGADELHCNVDADEPSEPWRGPAKVGREAAPARDHCAPGHAA